MSKINWIKQEDIDDAKALEEQMKAEKEKFKGKDFKTLVSKEKDGLLEKIAKDLGYL